MPASAAGRGLVRLANDDGTPIGLGAIVRVTYDAAIVVAVAPRPIVPSKLRVFAGGASAPEKDVAVLGDAREGPIVLAFTRLGRDLRPYDVASTPPQPSEYVQLCIATRSNVGVDRIDVTGTDGFVPAPPLLVSSRVLVGQGRADRVVVAAAPQIDPQDARSPKERARDAVGGLVIDRFGRLAGFVDGAEDERPLASSPAALLPTLRRKILAPPGADMVRGDDGFLWWSVGVARAEGLPRIVENGEPLDLLLDVRVAGRSGGTVELPQGAAATAAVGTIGVATVGPVALGLVSRGSSLFRGETREDITVPATVPSIEPRLALKLEVLPDVPERYPSARGGARFATIDARFASLDPDRKGEPWRTVALPRSVNFGRVADGRVALDEAKATEFWAIDVDQAGPVLAVLYRRSVGASVEARAWSAGFDRVEIALDVAPLERHLAWTSGDLLRGRTIARVRQTGGTGACAYELMLVPRHDAGDVVAALFKLIGREAVREAAGVLDTEAFSDELAALLLALDLPQDRISGALVEQLSSEKIPGVARRVVFRLIDRRETTSELTALLEQTLAQNGAGARYAALILARATPDAPNLRAALRQCLADPDPYVRARVLRAAVHGSDVAFLDEIVRSLGEDDAPIVERALAAVVARARALRGTD